jgi:hypothetical protein
VIYIQCTSIWPLSYCKITYFRTNIFRLVHIQMPIGQSKVCLLQITPLKGVRLTSHVHSHLSLYYLFLLPQSNLVPVTKLLYSLALSHSGWTENVVGPSRRQAAGEWQLDWLVCTTLMISDVRWAVMMAIDITSYSSSNGLLSRRTSVCETCMSVWNVKIRIYWIKIKVVNWRNDL